MSWLIIIIDDVTNPEPCKGVCNIDAGNIMSAIASVNRRVDDMARPYQLDTVRHMDDMVIFSKTRHQLKRIIKRAYACIYELGLTFARDKTWMERVRKGFDFLGYRIGPNGESMAQCSWDHMRARIHRLYEQGASKRRLVQYVKNWIRWAKTRVSLNVKALILKTTEILRNPFNFSEPLAAH